MFFDRQIIKPTGSYSEQTEKLQNEIAAADAIVLGAGAGLSTSAGFTYSGERFQKYFSDFAAKYHFTDMYSGGFYPYQTWEEYWAYWSQYTRDYKVSFLAQSERKPQCHLYLYQYWRSICSTRDFTTEYFD